MIINADDANLQVLVHEKVHAWHRTLEILSDQGEELDDD